jgi:hypothetical protein
MAVQPYTDGIELITDYARNSRYAFAGMRPSDVVFVETALNMMGGAPSKSLPE